MRELSVNIAKHYKTVNGGAVNFFALGVNTWSSLPGNAGEVKSFGVFKTMLDSFILSRELQE